MSNIAQVIFFSLVGGVFSLVGGFILLASKKRAHLLARYATPFAAGALLAAAFTDLLPEAAHQGSAEDALTFTMVGILVFFLLERFLHWFHHHHQDDKKHTDPDAPLIIIGDTIHNFIDGIAIASGFLVNPSTGIVVTLAVAAHEIPQEIGDFGLLISKGMSRRKVIYVNFISALATTLAAVIFFHLGQDYSLRLDIILGIVAGFFIYVAVSDIIPSIHRQEETKLAGVQTMLLVLGVVIVGFMTSQLHGIIDQEHTKAKTESSSMHSHDEEDHEHEHEEENHSH